MSRATVAGALLRGCLAAMAVAGLVATAVTVAFAIAEGSTDGPSQLAILALVTFVATDSLMLPGLLLALPLAALAAWRFNGGLGAALATGSLAGAALELVLTVMLAARPPAAVDALTIGDAAIAGAAFAWPVWHRCVAPRRRRLVVAGS